MALQRPVELQDFEVSLKDVADEQLYQLKDELSTKLQKLQKTNNKLTKLINKERIELSEGESEDEFEPIDQNDETLFNNIIKENNIVSRNQAERIDLLDRELSSRGLPLHKGEPVHEHAKIAKKDNPDEKVETTLNTDNTNGDVNAPNSILL